MVNNINTFYADTKQLTTLKTQQDNNALYQVAKEFESIFLQMVVKSMRSAANVFSSDLMSDSHKQTYQEMYDNQLSTELARSGKFGLAELVVQQMQKNITPELNHLDNSINDNKLHNSQHHAIKAYEKIKVGI